MATIRFPHPRENILPDRIQCTPPPSHLLHDSTLIDQFEGSLLGLATGDALGASVEFRPRQYLLDYPVTDMQSGGTWGLRTGQWTDDTSMALCLASSLIVKNGFDPYDQLVRYKWWYRNGYLSSTGHCFDIGNSTRNALEEFHRRQKEFQRRWKTVDEEQMDGFSYEQMSSAGFDVNCGGSNANGNGALMRLAPVPLFFYRNPQRAVELSGQSARLTHGDRRAIDACRYYAALIVAALHDEDRRDLLSSNFYSKHQSWFGHKTLDSEVLRVAQGSFKRHGGYADGIRGSGQCVKALEAALWVFWSDGNSFEQGLLNAVNLGDDTDTIAAIYGQLAGAYYGRRQIPAKWLQKLYSAKLIACIADWLQVLSNPQFSQESKQQQITPRISKPIKSQPRKTNEEHYPSRTVKNSSEQLPPIRSTPRYRYELYDDPYVQRAPINSYYNTHKNSTHFYGSYRNQDEYHY